MEVKNKERPINHGRKIERVRKLLGMTQDAFGSGLGISKQAVSKLEQTEQIDDTRLIEVAKVLGVTLEGLKGYDEDTVLYNNANFYEGSHSINTNISTIINHPVDKIVELYELLLKSEREKVEMLLNKMNEK